MSSYPLSELYESTPKLGLRAVLAPNPLTIEGALNDAEFIDMRVSPQRSRTGIIFDIRGIGFAGSNTALVVLTGVGELHWSNDDTRQHPWFARRGDWTPTTSTWTKLSQTWAMNSHSWAIDAPDVSGTATAMPHVNESVELPEYILGFNSFTASGLTAQIYIGHVEGLNDSPPDMAELSDAEIIAGFPQWSSAMIVHEQHTYPDT